MPVWKLAPVRARRFAQRADVLSRHAAAGLDLESDDRPVVRLDHAVHLVAVPCPPMPDAGPAVIP